MVGGRRRERSLRQLNALLRQRKISMDDFMAGYCAAFRMPETPNYWALPAMGDAIAWTFARTGFARPESRPNSIRKTVAYLGAPQTYDD